MSITTRVDKTVAAILMFVCLFPEKTLASLLRHTARDSCLPPVRRIRAAFKQFCSFLLSFFFLLVLVAKRNLRYKEAVSSVFLLDGRSCDELIWAGYRPVMKCRPNATVNSNSANFCLGSRLRLSCFLGLHICLS